MAELELKPCHDCGVKPGEAHLDGCDTARCTACGMQRLTCDHSGTNIGLGSLWSGMWPGELECQWYGVGLNELYSGNFYWDRRFQVMRKDKPNGRE